MTFAVPIRTDLGLAGTGGAIIIAAGLMAGDGHAQSLSEALGEQLEFECGRLLGTDRASERLEGQLETICRKGVTAPFPTTELTGAGMALTGSASGQQQRLIRDVRGPESLAASTSGVAGASADMSLEHVGIRLFASVEFEAFDRDTTRFEGGYDSDIATISGGVGYLLMPGWEIGAGVEYYRQDGDFDSGGDLDTKAFGVFGFMTGQPLPGLTTIAFGEYLTSDFERTQKVDFDIEDGRIRGPVSSDYDGDIYRAIGVASYRFVDDRLFVEPFAAIDWLRVEYESYSQKGDTGIELHFESDHQTSLVSSLGVTTGLGLRYGLVGFSPSITVAWKHEFELDQRHVDVSFVNDKQGKLFSFETQPPDRNYGIANVSLAAALPNGMQPFVVLQTMFGHSFFDNQSAILGLSYSF